MTGLSHNGNNNSPRRGGLPYFSDSAVPDCIRYPV
jgi:hypothetical protein